MCVLLPACLSIPPHWTTRLALDGFSLNMIFLRIFWKICLDNSSLSKIWREEGVLYVKTRSLLLRNKKYFRQKMQGKSKHISVAVFLRKSCRLWDNVEKYGRAGQATDDNTIRRMRFAGWVTKATDTHSECVMPNVFHRYNGCTNAPYCYVICTLPVCFKKKFITNRGVDTL